MSDRPSAPTEREHERLHGDQIDPDAPPSAEELAASARLRDALEDPSATGADLDLVSSLRAAWSPEPLEERVHAELLDDLPMSPDELRLAAELREALDDGAQAPNRTAATRPEQELALALRSAWSPSALGDDEHRAIVAKALGEARAGGAVVAFQSRARTTRFAVVTGATTVLALAASVVVWIATAAQQSSEAPLARARSTQPLFDEPFKSGETSARIDRIAIARASDYRDNRFAKWGVR